LFVDGAIYLARYLGVSEIVIGMSIVAIRPGFRPSDIDNKILAKVQFANIPRIEVSSTEIRRRWIEGKTIRYMVTQQVWEYINENKLYL